ncbi:putative peptidoglycan binding protein [Erwinia phage phiEa2809]|uniref:Putative peptidoglycan binding protein n=1 Tax=Erwinia phage phiEa2809 TaxID=1564096 RepID=A0A0A0YSS3_9CAUD|nr:endolysin [Erwinia phage phiEa2809]AIX13070.1 putative peptidoglycan binding protein [Erwinia phage phiEa2809]
MAILKIGSRGAEVKAVQVALNSLGYNIGIDGIYGTGTEKAVRLFQTGAGLAVDGMVGPKTLYALQNAGEPHEQHLTEMDLIRAAQSLQCELAAIKAVNTVESKGTGFSKTGLIKILFERHKMYKFLAQKYGSQKADELAAKYPDIVNKNSGGYIGGDAEHQRLKRAIALDEECAYLSASYGLFQMMGFNYKIAGYSSAKSMFDDFVASGEGAHLRAFVAFIKADQTLLRAIRSKDWPTFAYAYNGPGYAANKYDVKMADAYLAYS